MEDHEKIEGLEEERKFEFNNFIGIYKNWFSPDNIDHFVNYYDYCESIGKTINRQKGEGSNFLEKADGAVSIGHQHEIHGDHTFIPFLQYINGYPLEHYNAKYPGLVDHCQFIVRYKKQNQAKDIMYGIVNMTLQNLKEFLHGHYF